MTNIDNDNDKPLAAPPAQRERDQEDLWAFMPLVVMLVITLLVVLDRA